MLPGRAVGRAWAQGCGGTETVLVQFSSPMVYRVNGAPDADVTLIEFDSEMKYVANVADPGIGMAWTAESFDDSGWSTGIYGVGYELAPPGALGLIQTFVPAHSFSVFTRATRHSGATSSACVNSTISGGFWL